MIGHETVTEKMSSVEAKLNYFQKFAASTKWMYEGFFCASIMLFTSSAPNSYV